MSTRGEYSIINNLNNLRSNLQSLIKKVFFVCGCVCGRVAHVYSDAYHSHHTESVMHSNDTQDNTALMLVMNMIGLLVCM